MAIISDKLDHDARLVSVLWRLARETGRRHIARYAAAMAMILLVGATTVGVAHYSGQVFAAVFEQRDPTMLQYVAWSVAILFLVRGLATFGQAVLLTQIGNAIVLETQVRMFRKVIAQEPAFLAKSTTGEIVTLINNSASAAMALMRVIVVSLGRELFTLVGLLGFMVWTNWRMSLAVLVVIPLVVAIVTSITKRIRAIARRHLEVTAQLSNQIRSAVQGVRVVKAFGMERRVGEVMTQNAEEIRKLADKHAVVSNRVAPFMEMLAGVGFGLAIGVGGTMALESDGGSAADLVAFVASALLAYDPARRLGQARAQIESNLVGVRLMYNFLDEKIAEPDRPGAPPLELTRGEVRFEDVDFAYTPGKPVLHAVSFTASPGQTTAIVGRSGSGKTTIANLLQRFWRVRGGRILIDGQNIDEVQVASLRAQMAYVGQDAFVFDGSLRDNIMVGNPEASEEELRAAAAAAGALEFIEASPEGFDSPVGELGSNLSGGQRQRVAIARAILRDAPIVVLDEPTSALDVETERGIQASLERLASGRTTIVIAHRLSTIEHADHIIVVEDGRVVEQGDKRSLLAANGAFSRLYRQPVEMQDG